MFAASASLVQMIRTNAESAAKRHNKKVTKIMVAAVADIATDLFFTHRLHTAFPLHRIERTLILITER